MMAMAMVFVSALCSCRLFLILMMMMTILMQRSELARFGRVYGHMGRWSELLCRVWRCTMPGPFLLGGASAPRAPAYPRFEFFRLKDGTAAIFKLVGPFPPKPARNCAIPSPRGLPEGFVFRAGTAFRPQRTFVRLSCAGPSAKPGASAVINTNMVQGGPSRP